ncbi:MAG: glycosyltransferase [Synechococcaceae cyanobacterium]|nr:glycosyltransferase [Synechococcaceae cyanobacterium]
MSLPPIDPMARSGPSAPAAPAISVLLAVRDGETWLAAALASVLAQTLADFELLVVDDGSRDGSAAIAARFAAADPRLRLLRKPGSGLTDSLNHGLAQARGAWIARLDADDLCDPTRLQRQWQLACSDPQLVFIGSGARLISADGRPGRRLRYPAGHRRLLADLRAMRAFCPHSSALIRREALVAVGGYRTRFRCSQDLDLWLRLSGRGRFTSLPEPLVLLRQHRGQVSRAGDLRGQPLDARVAMLSDQLRRRGLPDPVEASEDGWQAFRIWVEQQLQQDGFAAYLAYVEEAQRLAGRRALPRLLLHLLARPGCAWTLLRSRLWAEPFAARLAQRWARRGQPCAV